MQEVPRSKLSLIMKNAVPITLTVVIATLGAMFLLKQNEVLTLRNEIQDVTNEIQNVTDRLNRLNRILSKEIEPVRLKQINESLRKEPIEGSYEERRNNLLKDFVRVSDDFQRPKFYTHHLFYDLLKEMEKTEGVSDEIESKNDFLLSFDVKSTGGFSYHKKLNIQILKNDKEDPALYESYESFFLKFPTDFSVPTILKCRLRFWVDRTLITATGKYCDCDFTLTKEEHQALLKTIELANMPEVQK